MVDATTIEIGDFLKFKKNHPCGSRCSPAAFADLLPTCFFRKHSVRRSPQAAACPASPVAAVFLPAAPLPPL